MLLELVLSDNSVLLFKRKLDSTNFVFKRRDLKRVSQNGCLKVHVIFASSPRNTGQPRHTEFSHTYE